MSAIFFLSTYRKIFQFFSISVSGFIKVHPACIHLVSVQHVFPFRLLSILHPAAGSMHQH